MVARSTQAGGQVSNLKGLDRAVKHYEAGDVRDVSFCQVIMIFCKHSRCKSFASTDFSGVLSIIKFIWNTKLAYMYTAIKILQYYLYLY